MITMNSDESQFNIRILTPILHPKCEDDFEEQILSPLSCLREFETKWVLEFDLPLVDKKDIAVSIASRNVITVEAKLKESYSDPEVGFKNEFHYFKKSISLPGDIDDKKITSNFSNGRLIITIPKIFQGTKIKVE